MYAMKKKILIVASCSLVLVIAVLSFFGGAIFQRGNPLPYLAKMPALNGAAAYAKVFENEPVYMTRTDEYGELLKEIEAAYNATFVEQMGSAFIFNLNDGGGAGLVASTEMYWGNYLVWEISILESAKERILFT
jgi:hypothetical protein